ncbi:uncharacterized protein A4U43_C07F26030 [Asparagus officinalis]|uniref:NADH dehydrogenase [ubiquinone] 1 alpha subcomplex subunit 13 n=1 Tax=Asparagus officinalis TaxID=4686 RepID=A0A5P1EF26_ASPOF|nr:uncharacterized protein A4U43_C07F26030 [Asparagus officinalis]
MISTVPLDGHKADSAARVFDIAWPCGPPRGGGEERGGGLWSCDWVGERGQVGRRQMGMIRKQPEMTSVKEMPVLQDGPPLGGFAPVRYARRIPTMGPSAIAIFLDAFGAFSWGMYQVGKGNKIRR